MYLTKADLYNSEFTNVYQEEEFDEIPFDTLQLDEISKENDGFNFIRNGELFEKIILPFEKLQPLSYEHLKKSKFFYAVEKTTLPPIIMGDITQFGIILNDAVYYIGYTPYPYESEGDGLFLEYIPLDILKSWLYRPDCWYVAEDTVMNIWKSNLPSTLLKPIHTLISGFENNNGEALPKYTEFLEGKFNHLFRRNYEEDKYNDDSKYFELRCLLDTRPNDDWSESGYQLFVSSHNNERNVYVVPKANVMAIKKLSNPSEAIDHYAAHLFSRKEGEFDFMQFVEDF